MKNYERNFKAENKILLDQRNTAITLFKQKIGKRNILVTFISILFFVLGVFLTHYLIAGWKFLGFGIHPLFTDYDTGNVDWGFTIMTTSMISVVIAVLTGALYAILHSIIVSRYEESTPHEIDAMNKTLEEKATEFILRTYLQDVLVALTTKFTLSYAFKEELREEFKDQTWFDTDNGELLIGGFSFDHLEGFFIEYEGFIHHLVSWHYHKSTPFHFFLEKIHPDGRVEDLEYKLPSKN